MRPELRTRASKLAVGALTGVVALGIVAFWAVMALFFWQALKPFRLIVADLWELIPADSRSEVGVGLAIAGAVLLILFVILGIVVKDQPAPYGRRTRGTYVGADVDGFDLDPDG